MMNCDVAWFHVPDGCRFFNVIKMVLMLFLCCLQIGLRLTRSWWIWMDFTCLVVFCWLVLLCLWRAPEL